MSKRAFVIVLDSFGIGYEPDADKFGDVGANTIKSVCSSKKFNCPNMKKMGLFNCDGVADAVGEYGPEFNPIDEPIATFGRLQEKSNGKDTTIGH